VWLFDKMSQTRQERSFAYCQQ